MIDGQLAAVLALAVLAAAIAMGPLPIVVRGVLRPLIGPEPTRRRFRSVTLGIGTGMVAAVAVMGWIETELAISAALLCLLVLLALIDWQWRWLPIEWTVAVIALGLVDALQSDDPTAVVPAMLVPTVLLLLMRQTLLLILKKEALGLGDIWLVAGLGAFLYLFQTFLLLGFAALSGLAEVMIRRRLGVAGGAERGVSFGTHICLIFVIMRNFPTIG